MLKTLRSKLLFFFLITTFLSIIVVGYISYESQKVVITKQIEQSLFILSDSLAISVEDLINKTLHNAHYLSELAILKNPNSDSEEIKTRFENFITFHPIYNDIIFVDKNGTVKVDMLDGAVVGHNLSERKWFQHTMTGETYLSDVYFSSVINKPVLVIGAPVKDNNDNIIGAVSPSFKLDELWRRINKFTDLQSETGLNGFAFLFNEKGEIIAHPNSEKIMQVNYFHENNKDINHLNNNVDNKTLHFNEASNEVIAYAKVNPNLGFNNHWYIGISVSKDKLFAPLKDLLITYMMLFGIVLILNVIAIIYFSNYLVLPVKKLVAATSDLVSGKKYTPNKVDSYQEINVLSDQFNYMIEQLQYRERTHKKSTLILETTDNGIFAFNKKTMRLTTFNKTCENLFGISKDDVLGKTITELSETNNKFDNFVQGSNLVERITEMPVSDNFQCECPAGHKTIYFSLNMTELPKHNDQKETEILAFFIDLSDKKMMEREMVRTEKLKVIGELSASFAHEIRNPLTTIRGFIQLMDVNENGTDFEKKYYKVILQEIDRINGIVGDLMDMAKPNGDNQFLFTNLNKLIDDVTMLYDGQGSLNNIKIVKELDKAVPSFFTYGSKLKQVFINIIKNAFEAMPDGGTLWIKTHFLEKECAAEILVTDTGIGMDANTLSAIGKPFFTTKTTGTGLGIPMCYMIIEDLGGSITVNSKLGQGTTFRVRLIIDEETYSSENTHIKTIGL